MKRFLFAVLLALLALPVMAQTTSRNTTPSAAQESSHVFCTARCITPGFQVNNWDTSNAVIVMMFNLTSAPSNGTVAPQKWWSIAAAPSSKQSGFVAISWPDPLEMSTGLVVVCSSTGPFTLTLVTTCTFSGDLR